MLGTPRRRPITMAAMVAITFDIEKRSIVNSTFLRKRGGSGLDRLALGTHLGHHGAGNLHPYAVGDLDFDVRRLVKDLGDLADDAARGHDRIAAPHVLDHLLVLPDLALLGPDDEEPHDDENQDERNEL